MDTKSGWGRVTAFSRGLPVVGCTAEPRTYTQASTVPIASPSTPQVL